MALVRRANRGVAALSYGWVLPDECDPTGERLKIVQAALDALPHVEGLFWDQATLHQPPRTAEQDREFYEEALPVMTDLYASAVGTTVLQLKEIPARPDEYDGMIQLGNLQVGEAEIRAALAPIDCQMGKHPGAWVTLSTHQAALEALGSEATSTLCGLGRDRVERPTVR